MSAIAELAEERVVEGVYAVARKRRLHTRGGAPYLALEFHHLGEILKCEHVSSRVFGFVDERRSGSTQYVQAMNLPQAWSWAFVTSVLKHSILPALSLILIGVGSWFLGMRSLVSNVVTEDYVIYAELAGVKSRRILSSYVMRNALVPQVTGLAISLGGIFNGAVITEKVFGFLIAAIAVLVLGFLSFIVWAHHMWLTGMGSAVSAFF